MATPVPTRSKDFETPAFDKAPEESAPAEPVPDNGQRRRKDDPSKLDQVAFATLLSEAEEEADEAHAQAKKTVKSLTDKIVKLNSTIQAGGISQGDVARTSAVQVKLSALDPTNPAVLPPPTK